MHPRNPLCALNFVSEMEHTDSKIMPDQTPGKKMQVSTGFKVIPSSYCTLKEADIKQQDNYDSRPWVKRKWN